MIKIVKNQNKMEKPLKKKKKAKFQAISKFKILKLDRFFLKLNLKKYLIGNTSLYTINFE